METTRRLLQRNTRDGKIGGVAAGLADYFGIDPTIVRLGFVLLVLAGGFGALAYLVAWIVMPAGDPSSTAARPPVGSTSRLLLGLAVLAVGLAAVAGTFGFWWIGDGLVLWPFVLIAVGLGLLLWRRDGGTTVPAAAADDTRELPAATPPPAAREQREPVVPVGWITFGVIALSAVVAAVLDATGALDVPVKWFAVYAFGVAVVGTVAGAFLGRVAGPLVLATAFALAVPLGWAVDVPLRWSAGDRTVAPATAGELDDEYRLGAGELVLDLASLDLGGTTREVAASVSAGNLVVYVPQDATVEIDASASAGEVSLFGERESGVGVSQRTTEQALASPDRLVLDLDVGIGKVEVR